MQKPRRILVKLSGEMLAGPHGTGIDKQKTEWFADEIQSAHQLGTQLGLVLGGGNIIRGAGSFKTGSERVTADYMGMLATVINSLALAEKLKQRDIRTRVMSSIRVEPAAEIFKRSVAIEALEQGEIVLFAAGTGHPYFSTDTAASLRAIEIEADLLAKATKVDGVYDKDPAVYQDARRYEKISYDQVLAQRLCVMDSTAVALCRENDIPVLVFEMASKNMLVQVAQGEYPGTLMRHS